MSLRAAFAALLCLPLAGCLSASGLPGASAIGAFASGEGERPMSAQIVEAMAGGLIGRTVGQGLDQADRRRALEAEYRALEYAQSGQSIAWQAADGRISGQVVAAAPYRVGSQNCRQYTHTVNQSGAESVGRGTACRSPDGSWTPLV